MSFQILCWVFVLGGLGTIIRYGFQNMDFLDAAIELLFINGFGSFFIAGIYRLNPQNLAWKTGLTVDFVMDELQCLLFRQYVSKYLRIRVWRSVYSI